jgi:hypothetical protein
MSDAPVMTPDTADAQLAVDDLLDQARDALQDGDPHGAAALAAAAEALLPDRS